MWPFKKSQPPREVTHDGVTAIYSAPTASWKFTVGGVDFNIDGKEFDVDSIRWAKDSLPVIERLSSEMLTAARESLAGWSDEINLDSARLLHVDLSEFSEQRYLMASYVGDASWGDLGVDVTIQDGKIIAADAGD